MRNFHVNKTQFISYEGELKGGWNTKEKLNELLQKEWPGQVAELDNGFPYDEPTFEFDARVCVIMTRLDELITEAEEYGVKANAESDAEYAKGDAQYEELEKEAKAAGKDFVIHWSMTAPDLDDVAVEGDVVFLHEGYIRDEYGEEYERTLIRKATSPTWRQVAHLCNDMISQTSPGDHIFFEAIYEASKRTLERLAPDYPDLQGDAKVYEFCLGS